MNQLVWPVYTNTIAAVSLYFHKYL